MVTFLAVAVLLSGCAGSKTTQPDPFFEKWQAKAEETKGYSPSALEEPEALSTGMSESSPEVQQPVEAPQPPLPGTPVTLSMNDAPVATVLRALARAGGQSIIISDSVTGTANISASGIPWDTVFLGIIDTYGLVYERSGNILAIKTPADLVKDLEKEKAELNRQTLMRQMENSETFETKIYFLKYIDAEALGEVFEKLLGGTATSSDAQTSGSQRASSTVDTGNNALIVHASGEKIRRVEQIIGQLDRPTPQVLIEAQIVETSQETARELGVQWGGLKYEEGSNNLQWIGGAMPDYEGTLFSSSGSSALSDLAGNTGAVLGYQLQNLSSDYLLTMQLSALQEEGKLNILSSPSIATIDNQSAFIESGREVPYQAVDEDGDITIEYKEAQLSLNVTPHIIDGNTLRLGVVTHKDELDFTNTVGGYPTIITKSAETNVILYDGQTMVIGGLSKETASDAESGVPVLKDIPVLGALFRSTDKSSDMEEVLIFITPHILEEKPETTDPRSAGEG
jgi:type IV pilus assembly protein PilQ